MSTIYVNSITKDKELAEKILKKLDLSQELVLTPIAEIKKSQSSRIEIYNLPDDVQEYEGVLYPTIPSIERIINFTTDGCDGILLFLPNSSDGGVVDG